MNEDEKLVKNEYQIANIFKTFFIEIVPNLSSKVDEKYLCNASNIFDPIEKLYKNIKIIQISLSSKKWYLLSIKIIRFPSSLLLRLIYHNK